jgi:2-oxoglutarate ferredoxin oxidoreductase subunit gamma
METSIIISGFGGQGVLFAGKLLAYAGMQSGFEVTWIPSYGPEMRGGTAHCVVILSTEPIGAPLVAQPDVVVALNQPSYDKYVDNVRSGGLMVVNRSLIDSPVTRSDIEIAWVEANLIAEAFGEKRALNMAALGALLARRALVPLTALESALAAQFKNDDQHLLSVNLQVLRQGYRLTLPLPI